MSKADTGIDSLLRDILRVWADEGRSTREEIQNLRRMPTPPGTDGEGVILYAVQVLDGLPNLLQRLVGSLLDIYERVRYEHNLPVLFEPESLAQLHQRIERIVAVSIAASRDEIVRRASAAGRGLEGDPRLHSEQRYKTVCARVADVTSTRIAKWEAVGRLQSQAAPSSGIAAPGPSEASPGDRQLSRERGSELDGKIRALRVEGLKPAAIVERLDFDKLPLPTGQKWSKCSNWNSAYAKHPQPLRVWLNKAPRKS